MAKLLSGTRIYGSATVDTQLFISGTNLSTSTTTGALQVIGGVGIGGGIYVSGVITATNTTNASSTVTGALQVTGGVGVGRDLWVGGTVYGTITTATNLSGSLPGAIPIQSANGVTAYIATGTTGYVLTWSGSTATWSAVSGLSAGSATTATNIAGGTAGQLPYQTAPGVTSFVSTGTAGNVLVSNGTSAPTYNNTLTLTSSIVATSTNTGALQVYGGVGLGGNLYVGGTTSSFIGNVGVGTLSPTWKVDVNLGTITSGSISTGGYNVTGDATTSVGYTTYNLQLNNSTANASGYIRLARTASTAYLGMQIGSQSRDGIAFLTGATTPAEQVRISSVGIVTISTTTNATSTTTGALQVAGGVGIGGDLFIQGDIATNDTTFNLINSTSTTVNFAGAATTINMGASNSGTTNVRNNLVISGNLTVQGTTTIVDSTVTNIADPILTLGGPANNAAPTADDNKDRGIAFKYVNNAASTSTGFFGYKDSTGYFTYIATATITNEVVTGTKGALDVNLAGGSAMALHYQSATDTTAFLAAGTSGYHLQTNGTGSAPSWVPVSGTTVGTSTQVQTVLQTANATYFPTFVSANNATATAMSVYTTSSLVINPSTGNVGIGTASPTATLHVVGTESRFGGVASGFVSVYNASTRSGSLQANGGTDFRITADTDPMTFYVNGSERVRIDTWGNVLIGKTVPYNTTTDVLTVLRAQSATTQVFVDNQSTNTSAAAAIFISAYGGGTSFSVPSSYPVTGLNPLVITVNSTERMRITSAGAIAFSGSTNYGSSGQILQSNGNAAPTWVSPSTLASASAVNADNIRTITTSTNLNFYPTFVSTNNGAAAYMPEYTSANFFVNPSTGALYAGVTPNRVDSRINIDKEIYYSMQRNIEEGNGTGMTFISGTLPTTATNTSTSIPFGKILSSSAYYEGTTEEYIPVNPGEILYGEIWTFRANGATGTAGTFYAGVSQFDSNKLPVATNTALNYFIANAVTVPTTGVWTKYSGTITLATSHTPFSGSDGGPVRYVRPYIIVNYTSGTIPTQYVGMIIRRQNLYRDSGHTTFNGGFVGVGTNAPKTKIQSSGAAQTTSPTLGSATGAGLYITNTDEAYGLIAGVASSGNAWLQVQRTDATATAYNLNLQPSGGNVGIGTTAPNSRLDVRFAALSTSTQLNHILLQSLADGANNQLGARTGITFNNRTADYVASGGLSTAGVYGVSTDNNIYARQLGLVFYTSSLDAAATEKLRITSAGGISFGTSGTAYGSSGQLLQSNGDASPTWVSTSSFVVGNSTNAVNSVYLTSYDDRIKAPADDNAGAMRFGFTSFANNNTSPYADYLHLRSYTDASGGNDNLVMFRKDVIGMRIWQQAWGTTSNYVTYKDVAFTDSNISGASGQVNTVLQTANASYYPTFVSANNASATAMSVYTTSSFQINPSTGNIQIGMTGQDYVPASGGSHTLRLNALNTSSIGFHDSGNTIGNLKFSGTYGFEIGAGDGLYGPHNTILYGSVGIGTNSPSGKLHLYQTSGGSNILTLDTNFGSGNAYAINPFITSISNGGFSIRDVTNSVDRLVIQYSTGNVGIGTTNPLAPLAVHSTNKIFDAYGNINVFTTDATTTDYGGAIAFGGSNSQGTSPYVFGKIKGAKEPGGTWNGYLALGTTRTSSAVIEAMRITSAGNVGIGTTSTVNKFEVQGTAGQLFSVSDSFTGTIFSANDVSGIPSIEVIDTGLVKLAQYNGQVTISTGTAVSGSALTVYGILSTYGSTGEIRASNEITAYYTSDARLKENIKLIKDPITMINQIRGVYFDWTDEHIARRGGEDGFFVRKHDIGVIAQEVQAVLPELVVAREDGYLAVKYEKIVPLLIEAIKSQQTTIEKLTSEIKEIKEFLSSLKNN
jgi:hypothetical protein